MKKSLKVAVAAIFALASGAVAFDWPQNHILSDSFFSYFAQKRGGRISPSLIFSDTEGVKASDDGRLVAVLCEHSNSELFESTLGNAAIISHVDDMVTVYANLDSVEDIFSIRDVKAGDSLGETSNSAWQEGSSCLEFQVVDVKAGSFVNPRILMPRFGGELPLVLANVTAVNRAKMPFRLSTTNALNAGTYLIYNDRQEVAVPYKSVIYINGVAVEGLSYDSVYERDGKFSVKGRDFHALSEVYPDDNSILLGEVTFPRGRNELTVVISDILGKEQSMTYIFDAR